MSQTEFYFRNFFPQEKASVFCKYFLQLAIWIRRLTQHCALLNPLKGVHIWDCGEQSRVILCRKAVQLPEELDGRETGKCPEQGPPHSNTYLGGVRNGTKGEEDGTAIPGILQNLLRSLK
jgi:hypothetical protein